MRALSYRSRIGGDASPEHSYARSPPEELVLPKRFPKAPFPAAAAIISPLAWQIGRPDLFDAYSAGVLLMQMAGEPMHAPILLRTVNLCQLQVIP